MDIRLEVEALESALREVDLEALRKSVAWVIDADSSFSREERHRVAALRARAMVELADHGLAEQSEVESAHRAALRAADESPKSSAEERASARAALSTHLEDAREAEALVIEAIALLGLSSCLSYMLLHAIALQGASEPPARLPYARRAVEVADLRFKDPGFRLTARLALGHHLLCVEANAEADEVFEEARRIRLEASTSTTRLDADIASQREEAARYLASRRPSPESG